MKPAEEWYSDLDAYNQVNDAPMICLSPIALKFTIAAIQDDARRNLLKQIKALQGRINNFTECQPPL